MAHLWVCRLVKLERDGTRRQVDARVGSSISEAEAFAEELRAWHPVEVRRGAVIVVEPSLTNVEGIDDSTGVRHGR